MTTNDQPHPTNDQKAAAALRYTLRANCTYVRPFDFLCLLATGAQGNGNALATALAALDRASKGGHGSETTTKKAIAELEGAQGSVDDDFFDRVKKFTSALKRTDASMDSFTRIMSKARGGGDGGTPAPASEFALFITPSKSDET